MYRGEIMAVQSYALFTIIAALFGFGVYRILTAEQNPAQASRLGNVRSSAVEVAEPRPNRFALEDDLNRMNQPPPEPSPESGPATEELIAELQDDSVDAAQDEPVSPERLDQNAEVLLAQIGKEWQQKTGAVRTSTALDEVSGQEVRSTNDDDFQTRLNRENAQSGGVQVSLIWDNQNDLDLSVVCPSGERISFDNKVSRCGGQLDVDMNEAPTSEQPVENIFWPEKSVPKGEFKVFVEHFEQHAEVDSTEYRVLVKNGDESNEYRGEITNDEPPRLVCVFEVA